MTFLSWAAIFVDKLNAVLHRRFLVVVLASVLLWVLPTAHGFATTAQTSSNSSPAAETNSSTSKKKATKGAKTATKSATSASSKNKKKRRKRKPPSARVRRVHRAFVASASLRPMAQQLLQERTPPAYAGVEAYARRHSKEDAGALAWLVLGYAHTLDHDFAKAIDPLNRAKANAGDLSEYVTYYLGNAYLQTGHSTEAASTLQDFSQKYPDSLLVRDADVAYANALLSEGRGQEAASLLEREREPVRADLELALGRAYSAIGQSTKASAALRNIYYNMPISSEADAAGAELRKLGSMTASLGERRTRADLLAKGKRYSDAANEYRDLLNEATPAERPTLAMALAVSLQKSGRDKDAKQILASMPEMAGEVNAQRLHELGEVARSSDDEDGVQRALAQLRQSAPNSPWLEQSLLSAGNMYLLHRDYDKAIDAYRELQQRFPSGSRASYAHWKAAWLSLRQGRNDEAKKEFEDQIALYPSSSEVPAALYWRGRLAEQDNDPATASAYYQKLSERFRNYYYAELARQRMKSLKPVSDLSQVALLDRVPPLPSTTIEDDDLPTDNLRYQKAQLLANGGLVDLAVRELQVAATEEKGSWAAPETAKIYQDSGRFDRAIESMKREVPNYFALEIPELPRPYWEALFPKPYWADLKRYSTQNALDPYLVASLIRQESEFNPNAVSRANAWGLMQLLPVTGKKVAREMKLRRFNTNQLLTPGVNLQLGTRYFRSMVDRFGSFEYALAAYNAGSDRVQDWLTQGNYRDPQEFVESIPFTETREYVQAILRNASVYRQLYGAP
jgi:peptidoglycan lytic transglycosylase